jgi:hypothetical protein
MVACRSLQALPRGNDTGSHGAIATSLNELWIKSAGELKHRRGNERSRLKNISPDGQRLIDGHLHRLVLPPAAPSSIALREAIAPHLGSPVARAASLHDVERRITAMRSTPATLRDRGSRAFFVEMRNCLRELGTLSSLHGPCMTPNIVTSIITVRGAEPL